MSTNEFLVYILIGSLVFRLLVFTCKHITSKSDWSIIDELFDKSKLSDLISIVSNC